MVSERAGRMAGLLVAVALVMSSMAFSSQAGLAPNQAISEDTIQGAVERGDAVDLLAAVSSRQLGNDVVPVEPLTDTGLVPAATHLMTLHGSVNDEVLVHLVQLDAGLAEPLGRVFTAYLSYDTATRAYFDGGPVDSLFSARLTLLQATLAFQQATDNNPLPPLFIDAAPAFTLDLSGQDSTYDSDAALQIDVGGDDVYRNKAGGGGVHTYNVCPVLDVELPQQAGRFIAAGYLADFDGDDRYVSGYDCGTNGGGFQGSGFLYDFAGDDTYSAGQGGVNGGGYLGGLGYLHDLSGNDTYAARPEHSTYGYGANGAGSIGGYGTLIDEGGHDAYFAGQEGANGGGYAFGYGTLVDSWGDDHYEAGFGGTNGAVYNGFGLLWDGAGDDTYLNWMEEYGNSNGNGSVMDDAPEDFRGCLYDADGTDYYDDQDGHEGWDLTVHPKGEAGSQYDDVDGEIGDCPEA